MTSCFKFHFFLNGEFYWIISCIGGISLLSSRHLYITFSLICFVRIERTSGTRSVTICFKNGIRSSRTWSSMSSYQLSTQIPLSGVVWQKFSARLSMMIVRSSGRPRFRKSLLSKHELSDLTLRNLHGEWCAAYRADAWWSCAYLHCSGSSLHTIKLVWERVTSGIAAVNTTNS